MSGSFVAYGFPGLSVRTTGVMGTDFQGYEYGFPVHMCGFSGFRVRISRLHLRISGLRVQISGNGIQGLRLRVSNGYRYGFLALCVRISVVTWPISAG